MATQSILRRSFSKAAPFATYFIASRRPSAAINCAPFSPRFAVPTACHFSSSNAEKNAGSVHRNLLEALQSEIENAQLYTDDNGKIVDPPAHFTFSIKDNPGERTVKLERNYRDERVIVEVSMPSLVTGHVELDETGEPCTDSNLPLLVTVTTPPLNGLDLVFDCSGFPDEIRINSFSLKDPNSETLIYEGPDFGKLHERLQKAFHKYLEMRDVRPSVLGFLHEYMIEKDNKEYVRWLKAVKTFVDA